MLAGDLWLCTQPIMHERRVSEPSGTERGVAYVSWVRADTIPFVVGRLEKNAWRLNLRIWKSGDGWTRLDNARQFCPIIVSFFFHRPLFRPIRPAWFDDDCCDDRQLIPCQIVSFQYFFVFFWLSKMNYIFGFCMTFWKIKVVFLF